jgi:LmbE family N-acetylglucosaminyl deacetylase
LSASTPLRAGAGDGWDTVVLSPHLDDAVLSCGGLLHARAERGERVLLVTLFAGEAPDAAARSPLAEELHGVWNLEEDVLRIRRGEDRRASEALGVMALHWDFPEALYRVGGPGSLPLYPTRQALHGDLRLEDEALASELADALTALPASAVVLAPLGVGGHVDHRLARRVARAVVAPERLWLYEDFPDARSRLAVARALVRRRRWEPRVETLAETDLQAKCRAIACYESQLLTAFRDAAEMERRVRRFARRRGGERLWRPRSTA